MTVRTLLIALLAALGCVATAQAASTVFPVAGTGVSLGDGDGLHAMQATFTDAREVVVKADGTVLVGDDGARVRAVATNGTISTLVGNGTAGSAGDGGPSTSAQINRPLGMAVAPDGVTVYVAEYGGRRIRRIDADGTINRVAGAGSGSSTFSGNGPAGTVTMGTPYNIGTDASGDLYIPDTSNNRVYRVLAGPNGLIDLTDDLELFAGTGSPGGSGDGGAAVSAQLDGPSSVAALPDGSIAIAELNGRRIRRVSDTGVITTIAGTGVACAAGNQLCGEGGRATAAAVRAFDLAVDSAGRLVFSDRDNRRIRRIELDGTLRTVAGSGSTCPSSDGPCGDFGDALLATVTSPYAVAVDPTGQNVYFLSNNRVRVVVPDPLTFGPTGPAGPAGPTGPSGPDGAPGNTGAAGAAGPNGAAGPAGPAGANGAAGADGPDGIDGPDGTDGRDGAPGVAGRDGRAGPNGADGVTGTATPLFATLPATRIARSRRSAIKLSVFVLGPAKIELKYVRGKRTVRIKRSVSKVGRASLNLGRLPKGSYRLTLTARRGSDVFVDRATLTVR